jgi:hypothetical protein
MSVPVHIAVSVQQFLAVKSMAVIPHCSHLPDLAPCDIFLFLRIKMQLQDHNFLDITEIQEQLLSYIHVQFQEVSFTGAPAAPETAGLPRKLGRGLL